MKTCNYEKDGGKVSIYCKPYQKAIIDYMARIEGYGINEMVEILLGIGIETLARRNEKILLGIGIETLARRNEKKHGEAN